MHSTDVPVACVSISRMITRYRFAYSYVSFPISHVSLLVPLWIIDSSMLTILSYAYSFRLVNSSDESLFLYTDSFTFYACLYLYLSHLIYIWLGMRTRSSSSIYFATTLQVRLVRSLELSLVPSSSLVNATALRS